MKHAVSSVELPFTITILGASGDLTLRKLMPALYAMDHHGLLPDQYAMIGFARRDYDHAVFRDMIREAVRKYSRVPVDERELEEFLEKLFYFKGDVESPDSYQQLAALLKSDSSMPPNHLFYLSIKPELFEVALSNLHQAGLIRPPTEPTWSRVVIEKPFGSDLASGTALNRIVQTYLDESQVYRIDHYLGKETVQNILSFRFANVLFEPLFNSHLVDHIQITTSETVGMESGRGAYYDDTGALRDMVQNHMLQLLCLVTMDPPASLTADAIRNEKVKILQSIVPLSGEAVLRNVIRGQYVSSPREDGTQAPGYLEEDRIRPDSKTETYVALKLGIENWRWAGVPVYLRTGKRLPCRATQIVINYKVPPLQLFQTVECVGDGCDFTRAKPNQLIFRIQPDEGIDIRFSAKRPSLRVQVESVAMNFGYASTWEQDLPEAYERLLMDVMRGDSTLFTRSDEVEAAWGIVDPVLKYWESNEDVPVYTYRAGSWGPSQADILLNQSGASWHNPS